VLQRPPSREAGVLAYIMVDDLDVAVGDIKAAGGSVVTPPTPLSQKGEAFATFQDPAGNLLGLYQQPRESDC
jgi:predicted enzyme related to lactoylglutathione lyase